MTGSGGASAPRGPREEGFTTIACVLRPPEGSDWVALTASPLPVDAALAWVTTEASGAVVSFLGVVRDHSENRPGVTGLTYEAYEGPALRTMGEIVVDARMRWPTIERVVLWHRTGLLSLSEASVAAVVSAPHRPEAFDAAQHCIDTLKASVPIWKREHWSGGSDWVECAHGTDSAARPLEETA